MAGYTKKMLIVLLIFSYGFDCRAFGEDATYKFRLLNYVYEAEVQEYRKILLANFKENRDSLDNLLRLQFLQLVTQRDAYISDIEHYLYGPFVYNPYMYNDGLKLYESGNYDEALCYICPKGKVDRKVMMNNLLTLEDDKRDSYWRDNRAIFTEYIPRLAYETNIPVAIEELYNSVLFSKGILFNVSKAFEYSIKESNDSSLINSYDAYLKHKQDKVNYPDSVLEISNYTFKGDRVEVRMCIDFTVEDYERYDTLSVENTLLSRIVRSPSYRQMINNASNEFKTEWVDIRDELRSRECAIEFLKFPFSKNDYMYMALVILPNSDTPIMVPLVKENEINVDGYLNDSQIYAQIWGKIIPYLQDVDKVFFSPDGLLHNMALEYVPDDMGLPINWRFDFYRLSSTRELCKRSVPKSFSNRCSLWGDFDYDISGNSNCSDGDSVNSTTQRGAFVGWSHLPGTKYEINCIANEAQKYNYAYDVFGGENGTERNFTKLSGGHIDIIHIATHGYSIRDLQSGVAVETEDFILSKSGLAFSGANHALIESNYIPNEDDNIMTAHELSLMDLSQVDLVTLSACESGVGAVVDGGVLGLQRGFKRAGVNSMLVSLWKIDDTATSVFMSMFYKYYFYHKDKYKALKVAQQALCRYEGGKYDRPECWAAFVLIDEVPVN